MDGKDVDELVVKITKIILLVEAEIKTNPKPMFDLILKRYRDAKDILENLNSGERNLRDIRISGSVRAFLDASSDYMNPVLEEMSQAEKLYSAIANQS